MQPALPIPEHIPVPQHSAFLLKPQLGGWQTWESPRELICSHSHTRSHWRPEAGVTPGVVWRIPSCLTLLQPALFFGMTPWFCSLELAGRWNTHSPADKGRQHLEAIIPALLYLSPTPSARNHSQYQQSLCHKPGKEFFPLIPTRQWRLSQRRTGWPRSLLPGHRRIGHTSDRHL